MYPVPPVTKIRMLLAPGYRDSRFGGSFDSPGVVGSCAPRPFTPRLRTRSTANSEAQGLEQEESLPPDRRVGIGPVFLAKLLGLGAPMELAGLSGLLGEAFELTADLGELGFAQLAGAS